MNTFSDRGELRIGVVSEGAAGVLTRLWQPMLAIGFGITLLVGVGFGSSAALHTAAHDTRHAMSFPCH